MRLAISLCKLAFVRARMDLDAAFALFDRPDGRRVLIYGATLFPRVECLSETRRMVYSIFTRRVAGGGVTRSMFGSGSWPVARRAWLHAVCILLPATAHVFAISLSCEGTA